MKISNDSHKEKTCLWLDQELIRWFENRIVPIDQYLANKRGMLQTQTNRTLPAIDSLIAANNTLLTKANSETLY